MTSEEWMVLIGIVAAFAVPSIGGWISVYVKLAKIGVQIDHLVRAIEDVEDSDKRQWKEISKLNGWTHGLQSMGARIAERLQIPRTD